MLYGWWDIGDCSYFTNSLQHIDVFIRPKYFELWLARPKDFIPLLYFWMPWPTGTFWHWFVSTTVISWLQFWHIGKLHRVFFLQMMLSLFFMTLVQLWSDVYSSQPSITQAVEIVLCISKTGCIEQAVVRLNILLKKKNAFKSIFQKRFGYTNVKVTEEDLYLVW